MALFPSDHTSSKFDGQDGDTQTESQELCEDLSRAENGGMCFDITITIFPINYKRYTMVFFKQRFRRHGYK